MSAKQQVPKEDLVVKRIVEASLEEAWKAWTEPEYVMRWWGPKHFISPSCEIDLREGGRYIFCMQAPPEWGRAVHYSSGVYTKIVPMERLEFTQSLTDAEGNLIDPVSIGMPADFPEVIRTVVQFRAIGELTEMTITQFDWDPTNQMYANALAGLHQSIDKMAESLKA